ncbi:hypothetical protein Hanom_Chr11g01024461 [Helianthus anomalus]
MLENYETTRATTKSELEPLKSDMTWLKEREIVCVSFFFLLPTCWSCPVFSLIYFFFIIGC